MNIELVAPSDLRHIEGFSAKRVAWLREKIVSEGRWIKPVALDADHNLVLDGQHRMEVALALKLQRIPAVKFSYAAVEVWSLRPNYTFNWRDVVDNVLDGRPYPYKTVKHRFPHELPGCAYSIEELLICP